jgi:hypothetical protein
MRERKRTFLCEEQWKTLPWAQQPKTPRDHIIDILVDVPSLLEGIDNLEKCTESGERHILKTHLLSQYRKIDECLIKWNTNFGAIRKRFQLATDIPRSLTVSELGAAHVMTLYWTTCLCVYGLVGSILCPDEPLQGQKDLLETCRLTIQTVPIFCHPSVGIFRVQVASTPMGTAMLTLASLPPEALAEERALLNRCLLMPQCEPIRKFLKGFLENMEPFKSKG